MRASAAILLLCAAMPVAAQAGALGRLFFTPEQRARLDREHLHDAVGNGESSMLLNGVVQAGGGARTIWINGMARDAGQDGERAADAALVAAPDDSRPVRLKVGQRLLLDQPPER